MPIYEHMVKGLVCKGYRMEWITYKHVHICGVPKLWVRPISAITRVVMNDFFFFTKKLPLSNRKELGYKGTPPKQFFAKYPQNLAKAFL